MLLRFFTELKVDLAHRAKGTDAGNIHFKTSLVYSRNPSLHRDELLLRLPENIDRLGSMNLDPLAEMDPVLC